MILEMKASEEIKKRKNRWQSWAADPIFFKGGGGDGEFFERGVENCIIARCERRMHVYRNLYYIMLY